MKHDHPQFKLRLPPALKSALEERAAENDRTLTAEIVARLEDSFEESAQGEALTTSTADAVQLLLKKVEGIEARLIQPEGTSLFKAGTPRVR